MRLRLPPNSMGTEVYEFTVAGAKDGGTGFPPKKKAEKTQEGI